MAPLRLLALGVSLALACSAQAQTVARWRPFVAEASQRFGVPVGWIERVMQAESGGRTMLDGKPIVSRAGAMGLMQLMPDTWAEMRAALGLGSDPFDPRDNIFAGTAYLRRMYDRFELHGSLQWRGRSNAKHECDISVVPAWIGEGLRNSGGGYPHGLPVVAIECKDKTSVGTLDETRQTIARMFDLVLVTQPHPGWSYRIFEPNTPRAWGRKSSTYISFFAKGTFGIARAGGFQGGARRLGQHYHVGRYEQIYAAGGASLSALQHSFRTTLATIGGF